jgi:DNA-binding GntR family transcriptional regulator
VASNDLVDRLRRHVADLAASGDPLPGEHALAEHFGTSRPAVREAIVALERDGLVRRRHGAGTFINPVAASLRHRFDQQVEFSATLEHAGYRTRMEVLEAGWVPVDAALASQLEVERGTMAYRTVKRWFADDSVAMVATDTIPFDPERGSGPDRPLVVDPSNSLFTLVEGLTGDVVDWEIAYPSATNLRRIEARHMASRVGTAVMVLELVGVGRKGRPRYHAVELHRPGVVRFGLVRVVD